MWLNRAISSCRTITLLRHDRKKRLNRAVIIHLDLGLKIVEAADLIRSIFRLLRALKSFQPIKVRHP